MIYFLKFLLFITFFTVRKKNGANFVAKTCCALKVVVTSCSLNSRILAFNEVYLFVSGIESSNKKQQVVDSYLL